MTPKLAIMSSLEASPLTPTFPRAMPGLSVSSVANIFVKMRNHKDGSRRIISSSGDPQTHPCLSGDGTTSVRKIPIQHTDTFICTDAVDVVRLLRGTRTTLMEKAISLGANVLVDEQWTCSICGPKRRTFKVYIRYYASAARAQRPDPNKPVGLDCVKGVAGLMTILERSE